MRPRPFLALLLILCTSCGIPNLKPFSDATADMAATLGMAYERTQAVLNLAADTVSEESDFRAKSKDLEKRWALTRKAIAALVEYSDSLASLAEAGKKGKETVARLTGAVKDLQSAVGALPLSGTAIDVINTVGGKIIEIQAERNIRKAVVKATEAVDLLAPLLKQNFADLARINTIAGIAWDAHVFTGSQTLTTYYDSLVAEEQRLEHILTLILKYQSAADQWRYKAAVGKTSPAGLAEKIDTDRKDNLAELRKSDAVFADLDLASGEAEKVARRQKELMDLINAHRKELATLEPKYRVAVAEADRVRETRQTGARLMVKAGEAIDAWQKAHQSLRAAVEKQQNRVSVGDLNSILKQINALVK